ncbi:hypothetical protein PPL_05418 [Heterostelium album PN500]|uniref:Uncharacterized protein n=1 Tax=Heterostelium pallidum (strain ATCC 26659 / Pp 5 / PN500) TaxID=670386 RepID=D3BA43_HETP5|nr:hypothetical protein PPL_05418 [Heterostelium album PN500]EFA81430.1 hypothetical protein PPL_05418 [Heterostelium album PN500]|eukprot:XP_020433548.1 hypothetical protein PPL_05418 [Heterostelium album PN500]
MFKVVASDLDGTLLSPTHDLTELAVETLKQLHQKGVHVILATGRNHVDVSGIRARVGIDAHIITSNGALVENVSGQVIISHTIEEELVHDLLDVVLDDKEILTNAYRADEWFMSQDYPGVKQYFPNSDFTYKLFDESKTISTDSVYKIFYVSRNQEKLLQLEKQLLEKYGNRAYICFSSPLSLEVMSPHVSKGNALEQVVELLGHTMQDVIAFGDSMNDLEMLSRVGKGMIMENGQQRLKDQLPNNQIIGSHEHDAVIHHLREIFNIQ